LTGSPAPSARTHFPDGPTKVAWSRKPNLLRRTGSPAATQCMEPDGDPGSGSSRGTRSSLTGVIPRTGAPISPPQKEAAHAFRVVLRRLSPLRARPTIRHSALLRARRATRRPSLDRREGNHDHSHPPIAVEAGRDDTGAAHRCRVPRA